jgi:hypothetical protein
MAFRDADRIVAENFRECRQVDSLFGHARREGMPKM